MKDIQINSSTPGVVFGPADLQYDLPGKLVAEFPPPRREDARLLVVHRTGGELQDRSIPDLPKLLRPGDLVVLNNTKVLPAKFMAKRRMGGLVSGLFVEEKSLGHWRVMLRPSRKLHQGEILTTIDHDREPILIRLVSYDGDGYWCVSVTPEERAETLLDRVGFAPLPPYIHRARGVSENDPSDRARYQTVYASQPGAIAAPTAGMHFTESLLDQIRKVGVEIAFVTLHVGVGTFKPIEAKRMEEHKMHEEHFVLPEATALDIVRCRRRGGRVVAVGTTVVRVLESSACDVPIHRCVRAGAGATSLFVYPPYDFQVVDLLLTNFHLPGSTLLALVMAFGGVERIKNTYRHAMEREYRFYSFGDAMLIE